MLDQEKNFYVISLSIPLPVCYTVCGYHWEKFSKLVRRIWCEIKKKNFYMISLSILITCLLYSVWILWEEVTLQSLLEVKD